MLIRLIVPVFLCSVLSGCVSSPVTGSLVFGGGGSTLSSWSDKMICASATDGVGLWDYSSEFKKYVAEANKRGLDCPKVVKRDGGSTNQASLSSASSATSPVNIGQNAQASSVVNTSASSTGKLTLTEDEGLALIMASVFHTKPENVHLYGKDAGMIKHCRGVSSQSARNIRSNLMNWIRLGSTEFESLDGRKGFLNKRKFNSLVNIFEDGEREGNRDGRIMRSSREFRSLCKTLLEDETMQGPPRRLMSLVRQ